MVRPVPVIGRHLKPGSCAAHLARGGVEPPRVCVQSTHATAGRPLVTGWRPAISPSEADSLAAELLGDLRTRLGGLHIAHARRVAARVRELGDERLVVAALLHDVVEAGRISFDELSGRVRDAVVMELVDVLTRRSGETETEYLSRCVANPQALRLKRVDLQDKLTAASDVSADAAAEVRRQTVERLALLGKLAAGKAIPPHRG
jgi:(p)ppGpp synthase/HD superfamily hydrolase